ncbi:uncharacterized protein LOC141619030 [Silene latifolia]|uniref:uncharacterized protein LOC141619030 n=1 Tax=Silene latifolia TaxID=37657 RepID=UPI003D770FF8
MLLLRAFSTFSKTSGLSMNCSKSEVYFNGMTAELMDDIKQVTGFTEGQMPFRYLGVPIQPTKLTKKECNIIAEKMVNRIRSLGAKKLSYAGRLTLINSVLNTLYSYWANIFILPKSIIRRIEAICRNYLWDGNTEYHKVPLVGWDTVTLPKNEGGLGIKKAELWNIAVVAKLVDWIYSKADRLWIRWINQIYIKQSEWHSYSPPADAAWTWKSICKIKKLMKSAYTDGHWQPDVKGYTVRNGYNWLRVHQNKPWWYDTIWSNWNVPKHSFISWITMHNGMNTREKLHRFGCCSTDTCCICENAKETISHLLFECEYSSTVVSLIQDWCGARISMSSTMAGGYGNAGGKLLQRVYALGLSACIYHVWEQRNSARINGCILAPSVVVQRIKEVIRQRIKFKCSAKLNRRDEVWLEKLGISL